MQDLDPEDPDAASHPNYEQIHFFGKQDNPGGTGRMKYIPTRCLPDTHYAFQEKMLAVVGLNRKFRGKLSEATSGIDYNRLGVNAERVILDRAPAITDPKDRPLHLHSTGLQIKAAIDYLKQKPWWAKRDPLRRLLPEEEQAARTAEEVTGAIEALEGGLGTSGAAEQGTSAAEAQPRTLSEEESRRREGKAPARPEDPSEFEGMDEQPLNRRKRKRTGPGVMGLGDFTLRPMAGVVIREPAAGTGRVPRGIRGPPPPTQPPPPIPSPLKTPPPPPHTGEMEVDQRTPNPKEGVPKEVSNKGSAAELPGGEAAAKGVAEEVAATEDAAPEGFTAEIRQEVDALTSQPAGEDEEVRADGDRNREGGETIDPNKAEEAPSTSFPSFKTFQSGDMGFSARRVSIPDSARAESWGKHGENAKAYFGGCSQLSKMEHVREWSVRATAGIAEPGPSIPDPAWVVHNHNLTCEMIDTLQERVGIAEAEAKLAKLKQEKAEDRAQQVVDYFNTFCEEMEKEVLSIMDEGEALIKAFGAVNVKSLKTKIDQKIDTEVQSRVLAREELFRQRVKILERQRITSLETQLNDREAELSQARDKAKQTEQQLSDAEGKLKEQQESSQKTLEEVQKKLADAEAQLAVKIYSREEYSTAYRNEYRVARRLALHAAPDLDWYQCEIWAEDPEDPHMEYASQAEVDLENRLQAEDSEVEEA
ncbi:uncharacterized protein LOC110738169 [Chenopodium quinoa]|uniref:uncharacterized protein LOC110738169 n=1 Tax=Chenopodium quinoa TaxID=63459 RepID=UPI000B77E1BB|nr:uncharacterized protein LOC110738169 [Chenopodium quinoa]